MSAFAAADLGAQSGRVAVGAFDGARLRVDEVHRFENVPVRSGDTLRWDFERLYGDVLDGLRAAGRVDSVAVDSWGVDFGLVDADGRLLGNPVHYRDARRARAMASVLERVPARELYERTGIQLMPINTLFLLAALAAERDDALAGAARLLLIPDLFHFRLCGAQVSERTNASTTECFDTREGAWAADLLARLDIPLDVLPEVVEPGTVLAPLVADAGVSGADVVAVATHDTASAVAAVPFRRPDAAFVSAGTWSLVGLELREPLVTDESFAANLTNEAGVDGTTRLLRNVTGLWLVHECRRAWAQRRREYSFDELVVLAREASPLRCFIEPNDPAFAEPGDMPARIAAFCTRSGQPVPDEPGAVVRCIIESLALKHAQTIAVLAAASGVIPSEVHVVGGGAKNELLCTWTASAAGLPVLAGPAEATLIGNLLVQAMARRELASLADAREVVRSSFPPVVYEPRDEPEWEEARARFAETVAAPVVEVGA